jgi:hypothetical protein
VLQQGHSWATGCSGCWRKDSVSLADLVPISGFCCCKKTLLSNWHIQPQKTCIKTYNLSYKQIEFHSSKKNWLLYCLGVHDVAEVPETEVWQLNTEERGSRHIWNVVNIVCIHALYLPTDYMDINNESLWKSRISNYWYVVWQYIAVHLDSDDFVNPS